MTLQCECGSHDIEIVDAHYPSDTDGRAWERYQCNACGRTGTFEFGGVTSSRSTGCVTSDEVGFR